MKSNALLLALLLLTAVSAYSQQKPPEVYVAPDAPTWMQMMQEENPNVFDIQKAYADYFKTHPYEKNTYTKYYKRWMHWARTYVQGDGQLHLPTVAEQQQQEQQLKATRALAEERSGNSVGWTFLGPKRTYDTDGVTEVTWQTNIYSIDISLSDPNVLYAGGESGGIWKTTDKGLNWTLLSVNILHNAFGAVKIHPSDPNTAYAATDGKIIKTTDGGATWATVHTETGLWVNEFAIRSDDPNVVLAASDQGLLRTTDGGANWTKLHTSKTWTVKTKPGDPMTLFAVRKNGSSSQFLVSTNGGTSFTVSNTGWWTPAAGETMTGAIIAVCPSSPSKLYAYLCGGGSNLNGYVGVFVSNNSGASWANTNPNNAIGNSPTDYVIPSHTNLMSNNGLATGFDQGFYDMAIIVNPNNANELIAGGTSWFKSTNGGQTWSGLGGYVGSLSWSHPDIQGLAAVGNDLWIASDGGLDYSTNFGGTIAARMNGISGSDMWGFDSGWNEDVLVGGRYHNGNMAWHQGFPAGKFYRMGGAESPTGYVNPGDARKTYFSDIGGYRLNGGFGDGASAFSVGLFPNESYAYYANSEMAWDPRCWNIVYIGNENKLWKSTDGGTSYEVLHAFPGDADNTVYDIEVSRSNPDVIYCSQWDGSDDAMWRSSDGGQTWAQLAGLPLPNNNDRVKMAVSAEDEDILWVAVTYGSNGKKIYKTTDGGQTWTNLTTSILNNLTISNIMAQYGTDGGIYLGTTGGVFYRNNTLTDWQPYSTDLPMSAETNRLKPFYRDGKIRNGCWGFGVWETDLYEPSQVIAQPIASALNPQCQRDTVFFDDYSVVNHTGATWSWEFSPTPQYVSATNVRNPKVLFGAAGDYTATMTLNGSYQKSLTIKVENGCQADTIPGNAVSLGGNTQEDYVALPALNLTTNTLTVSCWIKIDGIQTDYSSIFMHDGDAAGFNFVPGNNHLGYHWGEAGAWWWDSGLEVPQHVWTHVAMVVEPTGVSVYVNGKKSKNAFTAPAMNLNSGFRLGNYHGWGDRYVKGDIDEVCIFDNSLTQNEIRELQHLTKDPTAFPNLLAYYQFNEMSGRALDRAGSRHASLSGNSIGRSTSTAPVGKGVSARGTVTSLGTYVFGNTGLTLVVPAGSTPNGELCVSRIDQAPDQLPDASPHSTGYWVVNNYGLNTSFTTLSSLQFKGYGPIPNGAAAADYNLYKRGSFAEGDTWGNAIDQGDAVTPGANGAVTFSTGNGVSSFSQFVITSSTVLPVEWTDFLAALEENRQVRLYWSVNQKDVTRFIVEKSADGQYFQAMATVAAHPGSSFYSYQALDKNPFKGVNYYRLREEDRDGQFTYSPIRTVLVEALADEWTVSPNPISKGQALRIQTIYEGAYRFRLFDVSGKLVVEKMCEGAAV
ncbi:MAG TPA: hypothetical protein PLM41_19515, partial [Saprospiraceae bacterium]|nr:hypothetical protein [Saprospiraceae bacterium]